MSKVALADLNAADDAGFMAALGDVYEHAPWVAQAASRQRPFVTLTALHNAMMAGGRAAPAQQGFDPAAVRTPSAEQRGGRDGHGARRNFPHCGASPGPAARGR